MVIMGAMMRNSFMSPSASSNPDNPSIHLFMVFDRDNSIYALGGTSPTRYAACRDLVVGMGTGSPDF